MEVVGQALPKLGRRVNKSDDLEGLIKYISEFESKTDKAFEEKYKNSIYDIEIPKDSNKGIFDDKTIQKILSPKHTVQQVEAKNERVSSTGFEISD